MAAQSSDAEIRVEPNNELRITLPPGITAVIRKRVPVEELLRVLRVPDPKRANEWQTIEIMTVPKAR
jgi:hypothetical protein